MPKTNNMLIRLDESKKIDFKVALLRQRVSMQSLLESFIDDFIAHDKEARNPVIEKAIKKSQP